MTTERMTQDSSPHVAEGRTGENGGAPRSNILVFFCDQLRRDLLGCYGGRLVRTPNLDALASDSLVFDRAYTPTAICSPARASLMTGLYAHAHHMFNNSTPKYSYCEHLRGDLVTVQDWVDEETDYESAYYGKWHIGPAEDLFQSRFHHKQQPHEGAPPFMGSSHWHPGTYLGPLVTPMANGRAGALDVPMAGFPDVVAARYTEGFLRDRDPNRPFVAFCAFPGPHSPWMVPAEFGIRYDPRDIPLWPNRHDRFDGKPINQRKLRVQGLCRDALPDMASDDEQLPELLACNFSYIELIDEMVGEVVADLRTRGLYDTTTIIFTADHGDMAGAHGFLSKGAYMYDEIYRIPMLLKPAGEGRRGRVAEPVHLMDATATLVHLMSGEPRSAMAGQELHGQSLLGFVHGAADWPRTVHFGEYHGDWYGHYSSRMVTDGRWKLVWNLTDLGELYDLEEDPYELHNRFYDPTCRAVRAQYFEILREEAQRLDDAHPRLYHVEVEDQIWQDPRGPLRGIAE